jgi:uncharacterized protein YbjT (DUF2867 family)
MSTYEKTILVIGVTGNQGGAVARELRRKGWKVRGLSRNLNKPEVKALQEAGVEVVEGDMEDRTSLERAMKGMYGVFSMQSLFKPRVGWIGDGLAGEMRQGKAVADAARAEGIQHFIYSSVGGAERNSGLPHFECKWQIEQHIRALGLPATMIRPTVFMEMFNQIRPMILNGVLPGFGLRPDKTIQLIAADDIGGLVALAFERPQEYTGQALELAGDELTELQMAATFSNVIGRPVQLAGQPVSRGQDNAKDGASTDMWFNSEGFKADIPALRVIYPQLTNLETWLRNKGWENAQP